LIDNYLKPGYIKIAPLQAYVCGKAAIQYLVNGVDPMQYILNNTTLSDFAITCKKGPSFRGVVWRDSNGRETELFKCNRVYATKNTSKGRLYKYKVYKGEIRYNQMPDTPEHCELINDALKNYDFDVVKKDIDYVCYYLKTIDLLDLEWRRLDGTSLSKTDDFKIE
jgi:hypothetical protein